MGDFTIHLSCPFCRMGEIISDNRVKITVSTVCPICENLFYADLYAMRSYRPNDYRRTHKIRPFSYRFPCPCEGCRGELRSDGEANVRISLRCAKKKCRKFYITDLYELTTYPSFPIKRNTRNR